MTSGAASLLSAHEVRLNYGQHLLLREATLAIAAGEKIGLVGRNGSGKTSLLKIIAGQLQPDGGTLSRRRGLRTGYLPQEFELSSARTVRENIAEGAADLVEWLRRYESSQGSDAELTELLHQIEAADAWNLHSRIRSIATALHAPDLESSTEALSGGEKRRVALCRALAGQPDLLLLDEPTNHLDAEAICWLQDFLRTFAGGVIFVTHDRYFLDLIATRIIELADGRCFSHPGNYTAYLESKAARQEVAEQSERRRQRFIRAELEFVRAGVRAQRSKSRHRLETFYQTAGLAAPPEEREMDLLIPPPAEMGNVGVEFTEVGAKVGDDVERWLFRGLNLSLRPGQCTGVIGRNGVGKTTLLRLCLGQREPDEGSVTIGKKVVFNYIDQERLQLDGAGSVIAEVEDTDDIVYFGDQKISARSYLRRFLFSDERVNERVDRLSGGERARLLLAKVLKRGGNFLVLDEPTNDLDLASLRMLEEALIHFDGAVLVVSHDRFFLDRICDQVIAFENDAFFVQPGNYSYYIEKKAGRQERESKPPASATPATPSNRSNRNRPRKLSFKEQRELDSIEQTILDAEQRVAECEAMLNDPAFYVSHAGEAPRIIAELQTAKEEVSRLYARWGDLEQIRS